MSVRSNVIRTDAENTLILRSTLDGKMLVGVNSAAKVLIWAISADGTSVETKHHFPSGLA
jgi:hypothetical protein